MSGSRRGSLFFIAFKGLTADVAYPTSILVSTLPTKTHEVGVWCRFYRYQYNQSYLIYNGPMSLLLLGFPIRLGIWALTFYITAQVGQVMRLAPSFDPTFADLNVFSNEYYDQVGSTSNIY